MSTHKITAVRSGYSESMGDWENEHEITYNYVPGAPNYYDPSIGGPGGWQPGWAPEIEFISISPDAGDHGAFSDLAQKWLEDWASEWLYEHEAEAIANAESDMHGDPDEAYDRKRDEAMERNHDDF